MIKYFFILLLFSFNSIKAQYSVIKYIPSYNADITRIYPLKFYLNSFGVGYERCVNDHSSVELLLFRARMIAYTPEGETKVLDGFGVETSYRYYFQTNNEYLTYAPFEFYVAPTLNYTQMQTPYLNDLQKLQYVAIGAKIGYQLILELYQEGFTFDLNAGFNVNFYEASGFMNDKKIFHFLPKIGFSLGYCF